MPDSYKRSLIFMESKAAMREVTEIASTPPKTIHLW